MRRVESKDVINHPVPIGIGVVIGSLEGVPPLPETTPDDVAALLEASDRPVVLNIWASWCIPCRSEAPLLERAAEEFADRVGDLLSGEVQQIERGKIVVMLTSGLASV